MVSFTTISQQPITQKSTITIEVINENESTKKENGEEQQSVTKKTNDVATKINAERTSTNNPHTSLTAVEYSGMWSKDSQRGHGLACINDQ